MQNDRGVAYARRLILIIGLYTQSHTRMYILIYLYVTSRENKFTKDHLTTLPLSECPEFILFRIIAKILQSLTDDSNPRYMRERVKCVTIFIKNSCARGTNKKYIKKK